jgi:4-hydroxybenzoate polyprenyltransferase
VDKTKWLPTPREEATSVENVLPTVPLCVDLDGTLVHTNTLHETFLAILGNPKTLAAVPFWLIAGKSKLQHELAHYTPLNPALLPYNEPLLAYLRQQKQTGRRLILCTVADQSVAEAINAHLGLFAEVFGSHAGCNLRGAEKARVLVECFGSRGFSYAGNDHTALEVWRNAKSAILVNTSPKLTKRASALLPIELHIDAAKSQWYAFLKALRPHQWVKNLLVFVPIITANAMGNLDDWRYAGLLFMAFCAVASSLYLLNDLTDLAADRQHPRKKARPLASGALPLAKGCACMPLLLVLGIMLAGLAGAVWAVVLYAAISMLYSFWLKELPLIDLFALTSLYTLRLFAGGAATRHEVSLWLLAFSSFLFFSLASVKRVSELMLQHDTGVIARRGYSRNDLQIVQSMGVSASFVSAMILALYVQSPEITARYVRPRWLWSLVPLMLFWQCHLWFATTRQNMHDDPLVYAANDWVSRIVILCLILIFIVSTLSL